MPLFCLVADYELKDIQESLPKNVNSEQGPEELEEKELYFTTQALALAYLAKIQGDPDHSELSVLRLPLPSDLTKVWSSWTFCDGERIWGGPFSSEGEALDAVRRIHKEGSELCECQDTDAVLVDVSGTFDCQQEWEVKTFSVLSKLPPG